MALLGALGLDLTAPRRLGSVSARQCRRERDFSRSAVALVRAREQHWRVLLYSTETAVLSSSLLTLGQLSATDVNTKQPQLCELRWDSTS